MNIICTGSTGFLGTHLMSHLRALGYTPFGVTSKAYDLRREAHLDALFKHAGTPDVIFHLAANVGGIQYNIDNPGSIFYDNVMMTTQLIHKAMLAGCQKFIMVGTVCSYPAYPPSPTNEKQLWHGHPEESNGAYGVSKLIALTQLKAYHRQYKLNFSYPILANLYGPGDSGFIKSHKAHLIPSLIKKFTSNTDKITMFGKGDLTRDFLYVEDAAEALRRMMDIDYLKPLNVATGDEVSKHRLVNHLVELTGYQGTVEWDGNRDNGQLRRCYDTYQMKRVLNWQPPNGIKEGLKKTIEWWKNDTSHSNDQR